MEVSFKESQKEGRKAAHDPNSKEKDCPYPEDSLNAAMWIGEFRRERDLINDKINNKNPTRKFGYRGRKTIGKVYLREVDKKKLK